MPSGRFAANGAWLAVQVMAQLPAATANLARWTARIGLGEQIATTKTRSGDGSSPWWDGSPARHAASPCICHESVGWPWETQFSRALARLRAIPLPA